MKMLDPEDAGQTNREMIDWLLHSARSSFEPESTVARANVCALLEIADAITGLAAEVEKLGWSAQDRERVRDR